MSSVIAENLISISRELPPSVKLVAVSKFKPESDIMEAYSAGQRAFAESRPQEFKSKALNLPKDIEWHFIGHLQTNKIKMVVPFVHLIHSVDSENLLCEIESYCARNALTVQVLLEVHIASEESKQGFSDEELEDIVERVLPSLGHVTVRGVMGMASFTENEETIKNEFAHLNMLFDSIKSKQLPYLKEFDQKSFGMSNDYMIAAGMGSTMVRVGTKIFGSRNQQL